MVELQTSAATMENSTEAAQKKENNSTSGYLAKENETLITDIRTPMFTVALFTIAKVRKQLKHPAVDER